MTARLLALLACVIWSASMFAQPQPPADATMIARIRSEGLDRSQVDAMFTQLVTVIGPRLTNSPAHRRAAAWAEERLGAMGLANVHTESFEFGRGWTLERFSIEMIEPRYQPLLGYPKGWSPSTNGRIVATPIYVPGATADSLSAHAGRLQGAILMPSRLQSFFIREDRAPASGDLVMKNAPPRLSNAEQQQLAAKIKAEGVAVTLEPNLGEHGTVFVTGRDPGPNGVTAIVLASEHYNLIARLLEQKIPVRIAVDVQGRYQEQDLGAPNVIAELPGVDEAVKDEVVMVGAHLDSWHTAEGATDNADGVATAMEALRILTALRVQPRRTIRLALWGGEEQGLLGSRAWVAKHLAGDANATAREKFSAYFNLDNGYPPISGFYLEGNRAFQPIMEGWLKPFADLGATIATLQGIGATDHLSFKGVGVPGFQAVQSYVDYDVRTHHTNVDNAERVAPDALKQAATVMAGVLYQAATSTTKVPR
jgi:carboxypeptidase Q